MKKFLLIPLFLACLCCVDSGSTLSSGASVAAVGIETFSFSKAVELLEQDSPVTRTSWPLGEFIEYHEPESGEFMTLKYCYKQISPNVKIPWLPSQEDMMADDWEGIKIPR